MIVHSLDGWSVLVILLGLSRLASILRLSIPFPETHTSDIFATS